jgi:hypothetical protein
MNKFLWAQAPSDEASVAPAEPVQHEKRGVSQRTSTASVRPGNWDLLDRIQIWMNEGGAGDDAR